MTSIGESAFANCTGLAGINLPNSVTEIGKGAFAGCSGLPEITFPNSVISVGEAGFADCTGLTNITFGNSMKSIADGVFHGCSGLTTLTIPDFITRIESHAFSYCHSLKDILIEDGDSILYLEGSPFYESPFDSLYIGRNLDYSSGSPFSDKEELISLTFGNKVTRIGGFYDCKNLTNVTLSNSITTIKGSAFDYCKGLTNITIPASVTNIGEYAFRECTGMAEIVSQAIVPPTCGRDAFDNINMRTCVLTVPTGSKTAYQTAYQWEKFFNIKEENISTSIHKVPADEVEKPSHVDVYTLQGIKIRSQIPVERLEEELPRGIYIINGKKVLIK